MKLTKKAKPVDIIDHRYTEVRIRSEYTCPCCHTVFYNSGPGKRYLVFVCDCGQELKIRNRIEIEGDSPPDGKVRKVHCKKIVYPMV
jgi:hypothetical protein